MNLIFSKKIWGPVKLWHFLSVVLLCIGFAIADYLLETPTNFGFEPNIWDRLYDFLDKWASAGSPAITLLAVLVALCTSLAGIYQTRNIQCSERKRRILKDIINWTEEVAKTAIGRQTREKSELWETKLKYKYLLAKSPYIAEIVDKEFVNLKPIVTEIVTDITQGVEIIDQIIKDNKDVGLNKSEETLRESIEKLLKEVASIVVNNVV